MLTNWHWKLIGFLIMKFTCTFYHVFAQQNQDKPYVDGSCGGRITQLFGGVITSPGYPDKEYNFNETCIYEIEVPKGYVVAYSSTFFDLEKRNSKFCYDYLQISNGNDDFADLPKYCGSDLIPLEVSTNEILRIKFVSDDTRSAKGFSITWYALNISAMAPSFDCDFDGPLALCPGWSQSSLDDLDWSFKRGRTPSNDTGPLFDHTKGTTGGRYAFLEASGSGKQNRTAILTSPEVFVYGYAYYCLSLWFHNHGTGSLNVIKITGDSGFIYTVSDKDAGEEWQPHQLTLTTSNSSFRIGIEAVRGKNYKSDVAVDDIKITPGPCEIPLYTTATPDYLETTDGACGEDDFVCDAGLNCISNLLVCDGQPDCFDESDESNCPEITTITKEETTTSNTPTPVITTTTKEETTTSNTPTPVIITTTEEQITTSNALMPDYCNQTISSQMNGTIRSPSFFVNNYPNGLFCTYKIIAEPGSYILFQGEVNLTRDTTSGECNEYVEVFRHGKVAGTKKRYCSSDIIPLETSMGQSLMIQFMTDESSTNMEFVISWSIVNQNKISPTYNCSFNDLIQICPGWTQHSEHEVDWAFHRRSSSQSLKSDDGYAVVENSFLKEGSTAVILSPMFNEKGAEFCLDFFLYNSGNGFLNVLKLSSSTEGFELQRYAGDTLGEWYPYRIFIQIDKPSRIGFEAVTGSISGSVTALRDVTFLPGKCDFNLETTVDSLFVDVVYDTTSSLCEEDGFICSDGSCFPQSIVCDGFPNCEDNSDEKDCKSPLPCAQNEFRCVDGNCILKDLVCDGLKDCNDFSDEQDCDAIFAMTSAEYTTLPEYTTVQYAEPTSSNVLDLSRCEQEKLNVENFLLNNPGIQDGPTLPECMSDGSYSPKQCNLFVNVCWCVNTTSGIEINGTRTLPDRGNNLNCSDISALLLPCGGDFVEESGVIESPNFPRNYAILNSCLYNIIPSDQTQYIEINVTAMQLGASSITGSCESDRLAFFDVVGLRFVLCGVNFPSSTIFFDSSITIALISVNQPDLYQGFSLTYQLKRCDIADQKFSNTASACDKTCSDLYPFCTRNIVERCICPKETPVLHNGRCITPEECPIVTNAVTTTTRSLLENFQRTTSNNAEDITTMPTLKPIVSTSQIPSTIKDEVFSDEPNSLEFEIMDIEQTTMCVKIKHHTAVDGYLVIADLLEIPSDVGVSDNNYEEVKASSPNTYVCFYDLIPAKTYSTSVQAKIGGKYRKKTKKEYFTKAELDPTVEPIEFEQTEAVQQWHASYKQWRNETMNRWFTSFSSYVKVVGSQLPGVTPDPSKCLVPVMPRCDQNPIIFVDYNGCLFFICDAPFKQGVVTQDDVILWEKEYAVFNNYLMPQWQKLLDAYSEASKLFQQP